VKFSRPSLKRSDKSDKAAFRDPSSGPVFSARSLVALVLFLGGIAWIAYYYIGVRPVAGFGDDDKPALDPDSFEPGVVTGWNFVGDLQEWNYLIGFGAILLGLMIAAHPSTPLGRGRGVVIGMLGCFLFGLLWICTYYVVGTGDDAQDIAVFNDLEQKNLIVGIGFMAVGFTFATRWE
jgi:hypothetical protein